MSRHSLVSQPLAAWGLATLLTTVRALAPGHQLEDHEEHATPYEGRQITEVPPVLHPQPARDDRAPQPTGEPPDDAHDRSRAGADPGEGEQHAIDVMAQEREAERHAERVHKVGAKRGVAGEYQQEENAQHARDEGGPRQGLEERFAHQRAPLGAGFKY